MHDIGVVCLGRFGDCINIMPVVKAWHDEGQRVLWAVDRNFESVLDGISYADRYVAQVEKYRDVHEAAAQLKCRARNVVIAQLYGNEHYNGREHESFAVGMWGACGMAHRWNELPLVFDRRDLTREAALADAVLPKDDKPIVLTCFNGASSPFNGGDVFDRLRSNRSWNVVDIGNVRAHRIYDLLGLMDRAAALVTIDTAVLHLSYASGVKTVALRSDGPVDYRSPWYATAARRHWVAHKQYAAVTPEWVFESVEMALR